MNFRAAALLVFICVGVALANAQNVGANQPNGSPGSDQRASSASVPDASGDSPQKVEPNPQVPATPQANSGNSNGNTGNTGNTLGQSNPASDAALQGRIQEALRNEPGLGTSHISVNVTDSTVELSGTVGSTKDKETAERTAESFDGNRQFRDKLVVTGQPQSGVSPQRPANNTSAGNPPSQR